ncbi:sulfatase, partial [Verrucomicrobiota bacterium]
AEVSYHAAYEPMRAVRTARWKYIRRYLEREVPVLADIDDSPSKSLLMNHGLAERRLDREELYDLVYDPVERCNRANDPAYADTLGDMRRRLDKWMRDTDDPLLCGPIPMPPAAIVNDPSDTSPQDR